MDPVLNPKSLNVISMLSSCRGRAESEVTPGLYSPEGPALGPCSAQPSTQHSAKIFCFLLLEGPARGRSYVLYA